MSRPSVKPKSTSSSNDSPSDSFTRIENRSFKKRDKNFINMSLRNHASENWTLRDSINSFKKHKSGNKASWKSYIRKEVKSAHARTGTTGNKNAPMYEVEKPIRRKPKTKSVTSQKPKKTLTQWRKEEKKKISDYLQSVKFRNSPTYEKVKTGHKIYPDASKYELVHGINSKASKEFRLKHGLNSEYKGKVKK